MTQRRERKLRVIVEAAQRALAGTMAARPEALRRCALVVVSRWDGRPANQVDPETKKIISFAEMSPTTIGFSFIPNMAASSVPHYLKVRGPSVNISSRDGIAAAWRIAERWLGRLADLALVIESELAWPHNVPTDLPVTSDYALAVLIGRGGAP
jgi:hypothetical protein